MSENTQIENISKSIQEKKNYPQFVYSSKKLITILKNEDGKIFLPICNFFYFFFVFFLYLLFFTIKTKKKNK